MRIIALASPTLALALVGGAVGQEEAGYEKSSAVLTKAMARADVHNKRVLALLVGDGEDVASTWKKNRTISRTLLYEFEIVQFAGNEADALAARFDFPDAVKIKPAVVVLDGSGSVLARMPASELATEGEANAKAFAKGWVDVMIDVDRDTNGKAINQRLKGDRRGGLPWMVILDADGVEIVSSNAEPDGGNIGGPRTEDECAWFVEMLVRSRGDNLSDAEIEIIRDDLEAYAKPNRRR